MTKGDPVDVATGRVLTVPAVDAQFEGPLGVEFARVYSSAARDRDVGLGFGWSHSFGWYAEARRRTVEVWQEGGQRVVFPRPEAGEEVVGPLGWALREQAGGFVVDARDGVKRVFSEPGEDRVMLSAVEDRNGLRTVLRYEEGRLAEVIDRAGRKLRVRREPGGRISQIDARNAEQQGRVVVFARYVYNESGQLVWVTDAGGASTRFEYDEENRLTAVTRPNGLTFHFVYDEHGRCFETWGDRKDGADASLSPDVSPFLADGKTRAKGILHNVIDHQVDGYCEVIDGTRVQRFFFDEDGHVTKASSGGSVLSRAYDALGLLTEYTDPAGNTEIWERDGRGRVISHTDAAGRVSEYERDAMGNVIRYVDPDGGVETMTWDERGNLLGSTDAAGFTTRYEVDSRGLVSSIVWPDGSVVRIGRDRHGNMSEVTAPNGAVFRMVYDHFGRQTSITGPTGATTTTSYDDRGDVTRVVSATGAVSSFGYDAERHLTEIVLPGGRGYRIGWAGLDQSVSLSKPDRAEMRLFYDFDQKLVCVRNELGEEHRYSYDGTGFLAGERTYDGRSLSYKFDLAGNLIEYSDGAGEKTEIERDAAGQMVGRTRPDGTSETFEYNGRGELVRAGNERVEIVYERDARGNVVRETQIVDGVKHEVTAAVDAMGRRKERGGSLGFVERVERDAMGSVVRWSAGGDQATIANDLLGREVERALRLGGRLATAYDAEGRLTRRRSLGGESGSPVVGAGQPAWVGEAPNDARMDRAYSWAASGELEQIWDLTDGVTRLTHDAVGRVLGVVHPRLREELYRYDAAERVFETGEKAVVRAYEAGGRLVQRGDVRYTWDGAGRLVKKEAPGAGGGEPQVWTYSWDAADRLISVLGPDGRLVEMVYDAFSRRVLKTEKRRGISGAVGDTWVATTRFVWDRNTVAHEIRDRAEAAGDPVVEERSYCYVDGSFVPFAHHEARVVGGQREDLGVVHYATDPIGTPTHLLGPDGEVVGRMERTAWGVRATEGGRTTPLRFQGQYEDEESGLYYNRHRYYDPETGTYLSADPIGLAGGHLPFGYVRNPFLVTDPLGLSGANTTITMEDGSTFHGTSGSGTTPHPALDSAIPKQPDGTKPPTPKSSRGSCAEVDALSQVLRAKGVPDNASPEQVKEALKDIKKVETTAKGDSKHEKAGDPKKACGFCRPMMQNLGIPSKKIVNG
ncbi:MAG: RHS repeat-associated core domain-containing protein [Polyangiaceae bacterium]